LRHVRRRQGRARAIHARPHGDARPLRAARSRNGPTAEMICPCSSAQNDGRHFFTKSHQASIQISEDVWPRQRSSRYMRFSGSTPITT
jgi:hypothetical protein